MIEPRSLAQRPSQVLAVLGGVVGTILTSALLQLGPRLAPGFPDVPRLIGGLFTTDPTAAFWLGFWLFFLGGVIVIPPLMAAVWSRLPGAGVGFGGAIVKGALLGAALWIVWGVLVPVLGALNALDGPGLDAGLFALRAGLVAAIVLLAVAVWEAGSNIFGYTLLRGYSAYRLLDFAAVALLVVIAIQLREIKHLGGTGGGTPWCERGAPGAPVPRCRGVGSPGSGRSHRSQ